MDALCQRAGARRTGQGLRDRPDQVYTGTALASLVRVGGASFDAVAGTTYQVQVGTGDSSPGTFALFWFMNDSFDDAAVLTGPEGSVIASNAGADVETGEPDPTNVNGGDIANTVWFRWTPTANGFASFTFDAPFLGSLAVYTGAAVDSLTPSTATTTAPRSRTHVRRVAGTTYSIQVGAYFDTPGSFCSGGASSRPP